MKAKGYWGKILHIDLERGAITHKTLDDERARKYIGGSGLGARILYDETTADTDPLGPDNPLIFAVGPLTGTRIFNSNRFEVVARAPLTGIYGEANCGGFWGDDPTAAQRQTVIGLAHRKRGDVRIPFAQGLGLRRGIVARAVLGEHDLVVEVGRLQPRA